ncbi:recombinase family protein [Limnohabitans sp.]|uniref:recombinase family protein n=1 Tax=Limnohabitans sp. TaxID=1907725 RepID=UPI00286F1BF1|nr:recombinase family protein [Limnohabitans sp.]
MMYGYARVSTEDQKTHAQTDALTAVGCQVIYEEKRSGDSMARPLLQKLLNQLQLGDVLVVYKLDPYCPQPTGSHAHSRTHPQHRGRI